MIKLVGVLKRPSTMSMDEFKRWMLETHAPLVRKLPGQSKYVLNFTIGAPEQVPQYDCIGEVWFDDQATLQKALESPVMVEATKDSESHKIDVAIVFTEEHVVP